MKITSIQQQKHHKNLYSVFIDNKYTFSVEDIDITALGLKEGKEVTREDVIFYKDVYEFSRAKDKALRFISFKMRTYREVEKKLLDLGYNDELIQKVMDKMIELNYIDDKNYTKAYINEKSRLRHIGKKLLKIELKNKGIDSNIIDEILENSDIDDYQNAYSLAVKKSSKININDKKELSKVYNMLIRKGFSYETASSVIKNIENSL